MSWTISKQAKDALRRHVLEPLAARCVDETYGGFLVDFDDRWDSVGPHDKSLEYTARMTSAFALLHSVMPDEGCDRLARHGCGYLQQVMWDGEHGGFFARVDRAGRPLWDGLKHPHGATYAVQALQLMNDLLPADESASWTRRALAWLDDVAWDCVDGGYWGSYRRNNELYAEGTELPTPSGRDVLGVSPGFKEINTQGDAVEMLTLLVESGVGEKCAERLDWMLELVTSRLIDPYGVLPYTYRRDWRPAPSLVRVGYQFTMARRLARVLGRRAPGESVAQSCQLVDFCLRSTRHPDGGFCYATTADGRSSPDTSPSSDVRQWWVQLEAIHTLHILSGHESVDTGTRARYREARDRQWSFVRDRLFDPRHRGIREVPVPISRTSVRALVRHLLSRSPSPKPMKSHAWKDPSHEVSTLLALALDHQPSST